VSIIRENLSPLFTIFLLRGLGAVSLLGLTLVISSKLGPNQAGIFFFSQAVFLFGITICKWGNDIIICKYIAPHHQNIKEILPKYVASALHLIFVRFLFVFVVLVLYGNIFVSDYTEFWKVSFYLALICNSIILTLASIFQAIRAINTYVLYQSILIPLLSCIGIMFFDISTVEGVWLAIFIASVLVLIAIFMHLSSILDRNQNLIVALYESYDRKLVKLLRSKSLSIGADQVLTGINRYGYIFIIGLFLSQSDVTFFTVAHRFAMVISFLLIIINAYSAPIYATLIENKNIKELSAFFYRNVKLGLFFSIIAFSFLLFFSGFLSQISNIPNDIFIYLFVLLAFGEVVNVATGSSVLMLQMSNQSTLVLISSLIFSGIGLFASFLATEQSIYLVASCVAASVALHNLNCFRLNRNLILKPI
jgi:O-antigen/teichoic acid export membrane protein